MIFMCQSFPVREDREDFNFKKRQIMKQLKRILQSDWTYVLLWSLSFLLPVLLK